MSVILADFNNIKKTRYKNKTTDDVMKELDKIDELIDKMLKSTNTDNNIENFYKKQSDIVQKHNDAAHSNNLIRSKSMNYISLPKTISASSTSDKDKWYKRLETVYVKYLDNFSASLEYIKSEDQLHKILDTRSKIKRFYKFLDDAVDHYMTERNYRKDPFNKIGGDEISNIKKVILYVLANDKTINNFENLPSFNDYDQPGMLDNYITSLSLSKKSPKNPTERKWRLAAERQFDEIIKLQQSYNEKVDNAIKNFEQKQQKPFMMSNSG